MRACRALGWRLQRAAPVQASTNEEHARKKRRLNETIGEMLIDFCNIFVKHRDVSLVARQAVLDYLAKHFNKGSWTRSSMHGAVVGGRWRVHALAAPLLRWGGSVRLLEQYADRLRGLRMLGNAAIPVVDGAENPRAGHWLAYWPEFQCVDTPLFCETSLSLCLQGLVPNVEEGHA